jgi:hypothetical protein
VGKRGKGGQSNRSVTVVKPAPAKQANTAVIDKMAAQYNNTTYGPSAPLYPYPGLQPQGGPRQFAYQIGSNLSLNPRDNLTPFQVLRSFGDLYDGIRLCKQSWFDCAAGLEPSLVCAPGILGKNEDESKYADEMQVYLDFFESPDRQHTIHEWMNAALDDLCTIDAVAMYPRLTYGGELYSLDLIDGSTVKPLLDDRGRTPEPPFYAYEQIVYGAPSELFTSDELLYLKEHNRTYSEFGFSRVENILMRVNQALRKQSLDMAMFTDGNIPAGFVSPAADLGWTPDQLQAFQTILDSLYSGNDALRSRLKMMPPGSNFTPTNPISVETAFDLFLFTVTCASFGTTPAEAGFTQDVNRATGESQADVLYRRTLKPIALRFARLFNYILKKYFNEKRFLFQWKGYEAADDFSTMATSHTTLVQAGIESIPQAAKALKIPYDGPDIPLFIMTQTGPFVVEDLANQALRSAQVDSQIVGFKLAAQPPQPEGIPGKPETGQQAESAGKKQEQPETSQKVESGAEKQEKPATVKRAFDEEESFMRADLRKWRDMAVSRMASGKSMRAFVSEHIPQTVFRSVEQALTECSTVDEIKAVFARDYSTFSRATRQWRQPPPEQLACEQQLEKALKALVQSGTLAGRTLSYDAVDRQAAAQQMVQYFEQARTLGHGFAQHQLAQVERGIASGVLSGIGNLASKAANLVERAITWAISLFTSQVDSLPEDVTQDEVDALLTDVATQVAETLAPTDIQAEVESQVMDALMAANIAQVECINEPGACEACEANAAQGPIPIGAEFPSGQTQAPFHNRCRCHIQAVA